MSQPVQIRVTDDEVIAARFERQLRERLGIEVPADLDRLADVELSPRVITLPEPERAAQIQPHGWDQDRLGF